MKFIVFASLFLSSLAFADHDRLRRPRWVYDGDAPPNMCQGTNQAGDGNPHIVRSPVEAGRYCTRRNIGEVYCDAGFERGRYLDRYWVCEVDRF